MRFSVIIPFYNRADMVDEVLESVFFQTFTDFEVIAVDDGSSDATPQALARWEPRVRVLRIANVGAAIARNEAARLATGDYLAFLDSDDLWFPYSLALYSEVIDAHGQPAVVTGSPAIFRDRSELPAPPARPTPDVESFACYLDSHDAWRWFGVSSFVIRREAFEAAGGFAARRMNAEDADLMLRLGAARGFVHVRTPATFAYRRHNDNLTGNHSLNLSGLTHILDQESAAAYPGRTADLTAKRRTIITRHLRPAILSLLQRGESTSAWPLYRRSFSWHLSQRRIAFLGYCLWLLVRNRVRRSSASGCNSDTKHS